VPIASQDLFLWCWRPQIHTVGMFREMTPQTLTPRDTSPKGHRMFTAHIHAELIAAFFGDDEPCYGECQCAPCRASFPNPSAQD